ncbi:MFS transporter [Maricaulis parjimensis]|uniref:MFS transporter n=1 Tax=Maricaulis parjimensis TaxID=144023 RepID=UPI00193A665C|nr:MFS transporter [Maricaulis parjimensis]
MSGTGPTSSHSAPPLGVAGARHGIVLLLVSVMPAMAIISLVPVLPMLAREFSGVPGSEFLVPIALTIPALCVALFSPFAGWLSDRIGRKHLLTFALLAYAAVGITPFFLADLIPIIIARVGLGIAEAVIMTVATVLIADYFEGEERQRWVSLQIGVVSVSAIVLIAVGGALGEVFGSRGPFLMYLLALPLAAIVATMLFEPTERHQETGSGQAFPLGRVLPVLLITLLAGVLFYTTIVKLGDILALAGVVSAGAIGLIGAAVNAGVLAGAFVFDRLKARAPVSLLALGLGIVALGYLGMGLSGVLAVTAGFAICTAVGSGLLLPTLLSWVLHLLPEPVRGRGTGMWTGMFFLGQFVAPVLASAVVVPLGGLSGVLFIWALIAGTGAVWAGWRSRILLAKPS